MIRIASLKYTAPTAAAIEYGSVRRRIGRHTSRSNAGSRGMARRTASAPSTVAAAPAGIVAAQNASSGAPVSTSTTIAIVVPICRTTSTAVTHCNRSCASSGSV